MPPSGADPPAHSGCAHPVTIRRISFVVPVKNQLPMTRALVETTRAANPDRDVEWIIVDSGSTDGTLEYCAEIGARVVPFRRTPFNYCAAVNAGAAHATGDLWIISNNDIEFRSAGDLGRLARLFAEWPLLAAVSPGRESGEAELEFGGYWLYGACWAVRPDAFREWGGLPEALSGYGWDEFYTVSQCWRRGYAVGRLTGWNIFHHGSVSFAASGATTTPALRRNLSRLLSLLDAQDLDRGNDQQRIIRRLRRREQEQAPCVLRVPDASLEWLFRQGYAGAHAVRGNERARAGEAWVCGAPQTREQRQWLPWLANELRLQPEAVIVGGEGWHAVRADAGGLPPSPAELAALRPQARAVGPAASPLMPPERELRPNLRQRLYALINDWRHRRTELPAEW